MKSAATSLVLFDLDGTLADTAPDLAAVANRQRAARGLPPLPLSELRPLASHGARGMIGRALGLTPDAPEYPAVREQFFDWYEQALCVHTRLFAGVDELLATLEARGIRWGIVTNKIARFTDPLLRALGLRERAACVVCGDTTPHAKPHPEPLRHALRVCGVAPALAVYVGDDQRDVEAGRAAGVRTVVARYGYLGPQARPESWNADDAIDAPADLLRLPGLLP
ncbi:MAG: phosphoglycolate phosphatase [Sutterellaceae bacterium]|nr:phosphoglycolate phosphatase [Burkholderiaceae bacterium]MCX7902664.1 phosphoglycolate phosphatase [Burkholderiaceae bacterium]MDW8430874.1 phosphoglycolate phosphatase [Sutterellaceae bacterium]